MWWALAAAAAAEYLSVVLLLPLPLLAPLPDEPAFGNRPKLPAKGDPKRLLVAAAVDGSRAQYAVI